MLFQLVLQQPTVAWYIYMLCTGVCRYVSYGQDIINGNPEGNCEDQMGSLLSNHVVRGGGGGKLQ